MSKEFNPSQEAVNAQRSLEDRLRSQYRQDLEARGLTTSTVSNPQSRREAVEEDKTEVDPASLPRSYSIVGKDSFTSYNHGHEKVTGPSRLGDGKGNYFDAPGTGSVKGPSLESLQRGDEKAREAAKAELARLEREAAEKAQFTPEAVAAQLQYLSRKVQKLEKQLKQQEAKTDDK